MQQPNFTLEPMRADDPGEGYSFFYVSTDGGHGDIATVWGNGSKEAAKANAYLFAAAAELYVEADRARLALENAVALLDVAWPAHAGPFREQAAVLAKVLAKARGEA